MALIVARLITIEMARLSIRLPATCELLSLPSGPVLRGVFSVETNNLAAVRFDSAGSLRIMSLTVDRSGITWPCKGRQYGLLE